MVEDVKKKDSGMSVFGLVASAVGLFLAFSDELSSVGAILSGVALMFAGSAFARGEKTNTVGWTVVLGLAAIVVAYL